MNSELIRTLAAEYRREVLEEKLADLLGRDPAEMSVADLQDRLAKSGVRIDADRLGKLAEKHDSVEDMIWEDLFDDMDDDGEEVTVLLRELWGRVLTDRPCIEDLADAVGWLDYCFPEPGTVENAASADAHADRALAAVGALLDWMTAGPGEPKARFERLESVSSGDQDLGLVLESVLDAVSRVRPAESLELTRRLAEATDQPHDWTLYADMLARGGKFAEAEELYNAKAIGREPWNPWHLRNAGMVFAGEEDAPPADAAKAASYLDRAGRLAEERLERHRKGEVLEDYAPAPAADADGKDKADGQDEYEEMGGEVGTDLLVDPEADLLGDLEMILADRLSLAKRTGDAAVAAGLESRLEAIRAELDEFDFEGGAGSDGDDDGYEDDGEEDFEDDDEPAAAPAPAGGRPPNIISVQTVNRNDPCPCGSGRKYKKCCWLKS
jgi:hypothetical protein